MALACAAAGCGGAADWTDADADAAEIDADVAVDTAIHGTDVDGIDAAEDAGDDTRDADATPATPRWLATLESLADYASLRVPPGDVKYLAWVEGAERVAPFLEGCIFQDMAQHAYHLHFLRAFEPWAELTAPQYAQLVLRRATRVWWGGGVRFDPQRLHPRTGAAGVMLWSVYGDEGGGEGLTVADVVAADAALAPCMPFVGEQRAFFAYSLAQRAFAHQHAEALEAAGIAVVLGELR